MFSPSHFSFLVLALCMMGCKPFNINLASKDAIKLDTIKLDPININVKMDVYQHSTDKIAPGDQQAADDAKATRERIYNRHQQVQELKNNRWVIETHRGELQVREKPAGENGIWVEKTVAAENEDRKLLMRNQAKELNLDLHEIQEQFWKDNVQKSFAGEYVEVDDPARPKMYKVMPKAP